MIKHKLFSKGDQIHALISTTQQPNLLIPVRATIYDVKFDDVNPQYQIRVKKFYDPIYFLKKNLNYHSCILDVIKTHNQNQVLDVFLKT